MVETRPKVRERDGVSSTQANGLNESLLLRIKLLDGLDAEASSYEADLAATRGEAFEAHRAAAADFPDPELDDDSARAEIEARFAALASVPGRVPPRPQGPDPCRRSGFALSGQEEC